MTTPNTFDKRQLGAVHTVAQLEMSDSADHITHAESETLETESRDARA